MGNPTAAEVLDMLVAQGELSKASREKLFTFKRALDSFRQEAMDAHEFLVILKCFTSIIGEEGAKAEAIVNEANRAMLMKERTIREMDKTRPATVTRIKRK